MGFFKVSTAEPDKPATKPNVFIDKLIKGEVKLEDINEYIEEWHTQNRPGEIWEFLGFTYEEYSIWVEFPYKLMDLIENRK